MWLEENKGGQSSGRQGWTWGLAGPGLVEAFRPILGLRIFS